MESEESNIRREALRRALTVLDDRERQIFDARRLLDPPRTLDELASKFGISRERSGRSKIAPFERCRGQRVERCRGRDILGRAERTPFTVN